MRRLPVAEPDGLDGSNFNRASFDRGIEVFSTMVLQIGIAAATLKPSDNAHDVCIAQVRHYVAGLPPEDKAELLKILSLVKAIRWDRLQCGEEIDEDPL